MRSLDRQFECLKCFWRYGSVAALRDHKKRYRKTCGAQIIAIEDHQRDIIYCESTLPLGEPAPLSNDDAFPYIVDDLIRRGRRKCPFEGYYHCRYLHTSPTQLEKHLKKWHTDKYPEVSIKTIKFGRHV